MKNIHVFVVFLLLCSVTVVAETSDQDFFLRARDLRQETRRKQQEQLAGVQGITKVLTSGQEDFDVIFYELNLNPNPSNQTIAGVVTIRAKSTVSGLRDRKSVV
jgi:hypothetical protein